MTTRRQALGAEPASGRRSEWIFRALGPADVSDTLKFMLERGSGHPSVVKHVDWKRAFGGGPAQVGHVVDE